jgi:hypothetical protein
MRFKEYITEKLNLNKPVSITKSTPVRFYTEFKVNGLNFNFFAIYNFIEILDDHSWAVSFTEGPDANIGITGISQGKAKKVFSAVATSFDKFIKTKKPKSFIFSAEETSRIKLYNRLAKMITKKYGYKFRTEDDFGNNEYIFIKE